MSIQSAAPDSFGETEVRRCALVELARSLARVDRADAALSLAAQESPYVRASLWVALAIEMNGSNPRPKPAR